MLMTFIIHFIPYFTLLYLCGSIPFGLLFTKFFHTPDIRQIGSGNIGATNVLRTGHKGAALLTLLGDFLKGFVPCYFLLVWHSSVHPYLTFFYLVPVIAHVYPMWLKFKGGKGVATGLGVIFAFYWPLGLFVVGIWILMAAWLRTSSLSGLVAFTCAPLISWYLNGLPNSLWLFLLALLILYTHRDNIKRIIKGQEAKIGTPP